MYLKNNITSLLIALHFVLLFVFYSNQINAQENDTTKQSIHYKSKSDTAYKKFTYVRFGMDISKILKSQLISSFTTSEFQIDINYTRLTYLSLEFGGGKSKIDNANLRYDSKNYFARIGIDKVFFGKEFQQDMDNAFIGLRYAVSRVNRGQADYLITDQIWGNTNGVIPSTSFIAHWLELNGGFRMELIKNVFAGWNIRMKTFINPKKFELLPPSYVSGYGRGDKNTAVDYNLYLLYGIGKRK